MQEINVNVTWCKTVVVSFDNTVVKHVLTSMAYILLGCLSFVNFGWERLWQDWKILF